MRIRFLMLVFFVPMLAGCTLDGPNSSCKVTAEACDHCELECGHDGTHSGAAAVPI